MAEAHDGSLSLHAVAGRVRRGQFVTGSGGEDIWPVFLDWIWPQRIRRTTGILQVQLGAECRRLMPAVLSAYAPEGQSR